MGYTPYEYKLPEVLSSALSRFYSKPLTKARDSLVIDDKMGKTFWKNRVNFQFLALTLYSFCYPKSLIL